jgi:urease accessory protein UreH
VWISSGTSKKGDKLACKIPVKIQTQRIQISQSFSKAYQLPGNKQQNKYIKAVVFYSGLFHTLPTNLVVVKEAALFTSMSLV